jgi:4-hydroxy-tetrahydrodipicolinate synthase
MLHGIVAASLTPVTADFGIDVPRLAGHVAMLLDQGCSFVSPFGSTGEGPSFSTRQKIAALNELRALGTDMARLIPAAMSTTVDDTVAVLRASADLGCRATLVVPPYYYTPAHNDGIAQFYNLCAQACGGTFPTDVILYHIPQLSGVAFDPMLISRLLAAHGDRIVAIKDSTGDVAHAAMLHRAFPEVKVFTGDDRVLPSLLAAGGAGMIGGLPNVVAPTLCALYQKHAGSEGPTLAAQSRVRIEAIERCGGIGALRAVKAELASDPEWLRSMPPLLPISRTDWQSLHDAFVDSGVRFSTASR